MSADEWTECPFCSRELRGEQKICLRIDGVNDHGFTENGDFESYLSAQCTKCNRYWDSKTMIKPVIRE